MTVPNEDEQNEQPTNEEIETPEDEQPEDDSEQVEEPADEQPEDESEEKDDNLPEWARKKLTKANTEAASYRTKLREIEKKLESMTPTDEVDSLKQELIAEREASERSLIIENVSLKYKLPEKLQKRITGTTREEIEADAKELAELFDIDPNDDDDEDIELQGGLTPRERDNVPSGPRELAQKYGRGSKRHR